MRFYQRVEGVEKFFLRAVFSAEELDIVYEQQIERVVVALELVERLLVIGAHHVGDVLCRVQVADLGGGVLSQDIIADGVNQVRFA